MAEVGQGRLPCFLGGVRCRNVSAFLLIQKRDPLRQFALRRLASEHDLKPELHSLFALRTGRLTDPCSQLFRLGEQELAVEDRQRLQHRRRI